MWPTCKIRTINLQWQILIFQRTYLCLMCLVHFLPEEESDFILGKLSCRESEQGKLKSSFFHSFHQHHLIPQCKTRAVWGTRTTVINVSSQLPWCCLVFSESKKPCVLWIYGLERAFPRKWYFMLTSTESEYELAMKSVWSDEVVETVGRRVFQARRIMWLMCRLWDWC